MTAALFTVQSALDRMVDAQHEEREPDGKLHPSSLFGCTRQAIYSFRGTERTNERTASSKRTLYIGKLYHLQVQDALSHHPDVVEAYHEVPINSPDLNIVGSADSLLKLKDGRWVLVEIKSVKGMSLRYKDLPQEDHIGQAMTYMDSIRRFGITEGPFLLPLGDKLTDLLIVYVIKDDMDTREFWLQWSPEYQSQITNKVREIWPYTIDNASLPPRLPFSKNKQDWRCGYCPYNFRCWELDEPEVATQPDIF